ncbi:LytTR family DNA-binding domain-containing protein [Cohnella cellulosilytica]|uniref:LytTR family DNA-binding domain-containing protein n=1 Tax=Cohnella cellulosilytica TaxID=986710 RepID=A0ABW2F915_9BACL
MLDVADIVYLQTDGYGEVLFYTFDGKYRAITRLGEWSELLREKGFLQMDRGTVVNMRKIISLDRGLRVIKVAVSEGDVNIPVSERAQKQLLKHKTEGY